MKIPFLRNEDIRTPLSIGRRRRMALAMLARHDRRFGRMRWAEALAGEPTALVREFGLDREPGYGVLERSGLKGAFATLAALESAGLIQVVDLESRYQVLELTDAGRRVIGLEVSRPRGEPVGFPDANDQALFDRLVLRRNELAARSGCMPSEVARLRHLRQVVQVKPRTLEELEPLIAPAAVERFGPVVLEVLASGA
jgi:ATP-dependent DNA helicase RecQ